MSTKLTWTKRGWERRALLPKEIKQINHPQARLACSTEQIDSLPSFSDLSQFATVNEGIQIGLHQDKVDALPSGITAIWQDPDTWYIPKGGQRLFKVIDPITQAQSGNWGSDSDDKDIIVNDTSDSSLISYIEKFGVLSPELIIEDNIDIMGVFVEYDSQVLNASPFRRETFSPFETISKDVSLMLDLSSETKELFTQKTKEFNQQLAKSKNKVERARIVKQKERVLNQVITAENTLKLDSPLCSAGYYSPKTTYQFIPIQRDSDLTIAAQARKELFFTTFSRITDCRTKKDLYGPVIAITPTHFKRDFSKGAWDFIHKMYQHDSVLRTKWSMQERKDSQGNKIPSAFEIARNSFLKKCRTENLDEETIRKNLWNQFDRTQKEVSARRNEAGRIVQPSRKQKDSWWKQQRTRALKELFLTYAQWQSIFKMKDIVLHKMELNQRLDEEALKAQIALREDFNQIETLDDLHQHKAWAEKRNFLSKTEVIPELYEDTKYCPKCNEVLIKEKGNYNFFLRCVDYPKCNYSQALPQKKIVYDSFDFTLSVIDNISSYNEMRWLKTLAKKERQLKQQLQLFAKIDSLITEESPTNLPEEFGISCLTFKCMTTLSGSPQFAQIKDKKGFLFLECPECKRKRFLINRNDSIATIQTKKTLYEKFRS